MNVRACQADARHRARRAPAARGRHEGLSLEKRVVFRSRWLPYALVAPQIVITLVFFFWPAAQALWFAFLRQDAFGLSAEFAGLDNFRRPAGRQPLPAVVQGHGAVLGCWWRCWGWCIALLLALAADRVLRGAMAYRTLLIWPYAVAPAVAGVLWGFLFAPSIGIVSYLLKGRWAWTGTGCSTATRRCCWW